MSFVFENTPVEKAIKHLLHLCLSSGQVVYTIGILALLHYHQEFGFILFVDDLFLHGCYSLCDTLEGQKGHLSQTTPFPPSACQHMTSNWKSFASTYLFSCKQELIFVIQHRKYIKKLLAWLSIEVLATEKWLLFFGGFFCCALVCYLTFFSILYQHYEKP